MRKNITCIYLIENIVNGKKYIGQAVDYERRVKEHKTRYKKENLKEQRSFLYRAMRKYGLENFHFSILEECPIGELNTLERHYIKKYDTFRSGYNLTEGGQNDQPNKKIEKADVIFLRELYNSQTRMSHQEIWSKYFEGKITFEYFRNLWRGVTWQDIMPEVFTEENRNYYRSKNAGEINRKAAFLDEEVLELRTRYITETASAIHKDNQDKISLRGMEALLRGQNYKHLPVYKKHRKLWITINKNGEEIIHEEV